MKNKDVINDSGARLIFVLEDGKVYCTRHKENHHEAKEHHVAPRQLDVISPMEVDNLLKVCPIVGDVVSQHGYATIHPIGKQNGKPGRDEASQR